MSEPWKPETEKKYRLSGVQEGRALSERAERLGLVLSGWMLQKDWVPDFQGFAMRDQKVLLRIRNNTSLEDQSEGWVITLKQKAVSGGVHHNKELEASSDRPENLPQIAAFISNLFGTELDLGRLAQIDMVYAQEVGLTEHRMYLEKKRKEYVDTDDGIVLAVDELPEPAGWFAEIELHQATEFSNWESQLQLERAPVESRDYGEIVKELTSGLPPAQQRRLSFDA